MLRLQGSLTPDAVLAILQQIEREAGRQRSVANAARTLDLDIIDIGGQIRTAPDLTLPHPRAHTRGFVLYPLRDVAPGWVHPIFRTHVQTLIEALPRQDVSPN